jgi:hypothetical protein
MSFDIVTADIGSVIFQIFIIWLVSSFFSKKKKNKNKTPTNKDFFSRSLKKLGESVENRVKSIEFIPKEYKIAVEEILNEKKIDLQDEEHLSTAAVDSKNEQTTVKKDDDLQFLRKNDSNQNDKKVKYNKPKVNNLKNKLGLNSKASIKNAIVISEILNKPLSQRR